MRSGFLRGSRGAWAQTQRTAWGQSGPKHTWDVPDAGLMTPSMRIWQSHNSGLPGKRYRADTLQCTKRNCITLLHYKKHVIITVVTKGPAARELNAFCWLANWNAATWSAPHAEQFFWSTSFLVAALRGGVSFVLWVYALVTHCFLFRCQIGLSKMINRK